MRVVGIDVGGTFTDFILYDSGYPEPKVLKISSSANPTDTMAAGVVQLCVAGAIEPGQIDRVIHGTTVATNSVIERKGARTAMRRRAPCRLASCSAAQWAVRNIILASNAMPTGG
jgi:N-methylhydantoinase A